MLRRFKRQRDKNKDVSEFQDLVTSFDEVDNEEVPKKFKFKFRHLMLIAFILMSITATLVNKHLTNKAKIAEEKAKTEWDAYVEEQTNEPHKALKFYLAEGTISQKLEATSKMIAHVMSTGCSTSYSTLRENFDDASLEYLYDYLTGTPCEEYTRPSVVCIVDNYEYYEYLVTVRGVKDRYVIKVNHNNERPKSFDIRVYKKQNLAETR